MDLKLAGAKALVFGASTGIGKAIAQKLAEEGAHVAISARTESTLNDTAKEIGARVILPADLSVPGEAHRVCSLAYEKLSGLDILVTNTGGPKRGNFMEISIDQWKQDYQSVWLSVVESLQFCLPKMQEKNYGRILMITSMAGKEPLPRLTTSNGLRAGLQGLNKSVANEYASFGITCNVLRPGYTNTDRLKELKLTDERIAQMVPMGRLGEPQELAALAAFLASPLAGYITGQSISVDGGVAKGY